MVFNSLVRGLPSARTMPPLVVNLSCVYRLAAPQFCPVQAMKGCLFAHSWRHPGSKHHWGSSASLPHQVPNTLHGSPGLLWKRDCSHLHSARAMPPLRRQQSCVLRVAAPQFCPVHAKTGCLFTVSWPHLGSKDHRGSSSSLLQHLLNLSIALLLQPRHHLLPPIPRMRAFEMRLAVPNLLPRLILLIAVLLVASLPLLPTKVSSGRVKLRCPALEPSWPLMNVGMRSISDGETFKCIALCRGQLAGLSTHCNAFLQCSETPALKKTDIGGYTFVTAATHMLPGVGRRKGLMEHIVAMTTKHKFNSCQGFGSRAKTSGGIAPCATQSGCGKMTSQKCVSESA